MGRDGGAGNCRDGHPGEGEGRKFRHETILSVDSRLATRRNYLAMLNARLTAGRRSIPKGRSDDAEQPENQDQDQQPTKSDIHDSPPLSSLRKNRARRRRVPNVAAAHRLTLRYYFTRQQQAGFA